MLDNQSWGAAAGGGLIVGILVGLAIGTSDDTDQRVLSQVKAMEATLAQMQTDQAAFSSAVGEMQAHTAAVQGDTSALSETVSALSAQVERQMGAVRRDIEAARAADAVLGEGQVAIGTQLDEIATAVSTDGIKAAFAAYHADKHGGHKHGHHGKAAEEAEAPAATTEAPAETAAAAPASQDAGLTAGATVVVGEARLFAYRISEDTVVGLINGTQGISLKVGAEPSEIGGCKVAVKSIEGGVAALDVGC